MSAAAKSEQKSIVFVVDDDVSVRESLELLIKFADWQPETFESAAEFLALLRTETPSCLVLDVSLPDLNGLELQRLIASDRTDMPIIFITGHGDVPMTVQAMKAGAVEFLTKPFDDEVLLTAIRHAIKRSSAVLDEQAEIAALRSSYESLTPREQEVLRLVAAGMLNKQIGLELGITEIGLVYIAAFAPDKGESVNSLIKDPPPEAPVPPILPPRDGYLFLDKTKFAASFAGDVDAEKAAFMADSQVPWGLQALAGEISEPAWKSKPSWYLLATDDRMIPPPAQRFMSQRAGSTVVEVAGSHAIYVSQPSAVAALIKQAAKGAAAATTA